MGNLQFLFSKYVYEPNFKIRFFLPKKNIAEKIKWPLNNIKEKLKLFKENLERILKSPRKISYVTTILKLDFSKSTLSMTLFLWTDDEGHVKKLLLFFSSCYASLRLRWIISLERLKIEKSDVWISNYSVFLSELSDLSPMTATESNR